MRAWKKGALFLLMAFLFLAACGSKEEDSGAQVMDYAADSEAKAEEEPEDASEPEDTIGSGELKVHYMDVGQGDAILITCDGESMLIDAGDNDKGTAVWSYLQSQGVTELRYVIGTHPDADHIGGLDVVLTKFDCDMVMMPDVESDTATYRDVVDAMRYRDYTNTLPVVREGYELGSATFTIVAPNGTGYSGDNDYSIGIKLTHGKNVFLFTGDAEDEAEEEMLQNGIDLRANVLKIGHHGSSTSTSDAFLEAVNPEFAVISCGEDNSYGHPHAETLNKLREKGVKVFRTDEEGTIVATSDGTTVTFNVPPSESWKAGEATGGSPESEIQAQNELIPAGAEEKTPDSGNREPEVSETEPQEPVIQEPEEPISSGTGYVLNVKTKKFHYPSCSYLPTTNRQDTTMSREEIIAQGYDPCKRCNP